MDAARALPRVGVTAPGRAASVAKSWIWLGLLLAPFLLFVVYPFAALVKTSVVTPTGAFTLRFYQDLFAIPRYLDKTWNTLAIAALTTTLSLLLGVPLSFYLWKRQFPGKRILVNLLVIPYMTPNYILALAIIFLFGQNGALAFALRRLLIDPEYRLPFNILFTYHGILAVFIFHSLTLVVFLVLALLAGIEPEYEEAARSLGASSLTAIRRVVLPMAVPAIAGAGVLVFSRVMVDYVVISLMGGYRYATLAVEVVNRYFGYLTYELAAALAVFLSTMTMAIMYGYLYWFRWRRRA
ncbi:MAG: ABC transporter permease subunit [candidate division NC10 bacterium]|nr:ABC transporter permease subunit [candidate division NC10 bacterium]